MKIEEVFKSTVNRSNVRIEFEKLNYVFVFGKIYYSRNKIPYYGIWEESTGTLFLMHRQFERVKNFALRYFIDKENTDIEETIHQFSPIR